ncbi:MAG: hypothetical protein LC789_10415 [Actinobacteria bacterium]|nr:hypothetical protein [Actinomycetota bacterium]MCA1721238.1 hypothetical protein [Actinomycetota bacterium]
MSLAKIISARLHAILADYSVAAVLLLTALLASDASTAARTTALVMGLGLLAGSVLTAYPLGLVRLIPFKLHSAADYLGAAVLIAAPFVFDFADTDKGLATLYVVLGVADLVISLLTDYDDPATRAAGPAPATTT